jgi:predicted aspartyl protease
VGHVYVNATFHGQKGKRVLDRLPVDTGATYTILPPSLADEIGVFATPYKIQLTLADMSRKTASVGLAEVEVEGRREPVEVAVVENGVPVLGVQALEVLGFEVNPVKKKLERFRRISTFRSSSLSAAYDLSRKFFRYCGPVARAT